MDGVRTAEGGWRSYRGDDLGSIEVDGRSADGLQPPHRVPMCRYVVVQRFRHPN